jgi:SpoVK/Ycf46/Vps4 family AAA+-type ATPase
MTMSEEVKKKEGKFIARKVTKIADLVEGTEIPESDLLIKNADTVVQFEYIEPIKEKNLKYKAEPGFYNIGFKGQKLALNPLEMRTRRLLTSYDNTKQILAEANIFFSNIDELKALQEDNEFLGSDLKRAILLYSPPGYGKTSAITQSAQNLVKEDPKTIVINWPTSEIRSSDVNRFMSKIDYADCSRLVFIIEDIGGGEKEDHHGSERAIDSSLLNLLDGVDNVFTIPTFIIATTNHPGSLLDALADRPGRFDEYVELDPPSYEQRVELIEFIGKRKITDEEKAALKTADDFSPAHLAEVVKRVILKKKTFLEVIKDMTEHRVKVSKRFEERKKKGVGLGLR